MKTAFRFFAGPLVRIALAAMIVFSMATCRNPTSGDPGPEIQTVAAPAANPASGAVVANDQPITLGCGTEGATIYYTQDGSNPTTTGAQYSDANKPVITADKLTLKAIGVKAGMNNSAVMTALYTLLNLTADEALELIIDAILEGGFSSDDISAAHFITAGIEGVSEDNLAAIAGFLANADAPESLNELKTVIDYALVGIAAEDDGFIDANQYENITEAEAAIKALIENETSIQITWSKDNEGNDVAEVIIGGNTVTIVFNGEIDTDPDPDPIPLVAINVTAPRQAVRLLQQLRQAAQGTHAARFRGVQLTARSR